MRAACALAALLAAPACTSFSSYQSARLLPAGKTSFTAALSNMQFHDTSGDETSLDTEEFMLMARHGVTPRVEAGVKWALFTEGENSHVVLADGKVALVPGRVALTLPVGFVYTDGDVGIYQAHPGALWRIPAGGAAEVDLAARAIGFYDDGDTELYVGANAGLRLSTSWEHWAVHPELGVLWEPGSQDGFYLQYGVGVSVIP